MKFLVITVLTFALVSALMQPEKVSADTYGFIHNFKGTKDELFKALTERIESEMKGMKPGEMNPIDILRSIDLVVKKLKDDDIVSAKELRKFYMDLSKKRGST
ncbi:hypothetical protein PVAND_015073 [Polypedilum vanderplanki]|uniref:Uncharacterized protein n=1 Tax=Polypedilum vanderplanki TaxID=319348 RepID=A0A9J6BB17_POLVA|nr:hypothetical protein PVAND_015073 [Polypedilum vanderplanki]